MFARTERIAGTAAMVAVWGWMALLAGFLFQATESSVPWETMSLILSVAGLIVGLASLVALSGLLVQVGDARDMWRNVAFVLAILGVAVLTFLTWFTPLWAGLLSAASLIAAFRLRAAGLGSTTGRRAFVAAWPLSFGTFVLLDAIKLGRIDEYGDYPWAGGIGVAIWCGLFAVGLATHAKGLRVDEAAATA